MVSAVTAGAIDAFHGRLQLINFALPQLGLQRNEHRRHTQRLLSANLHLINLNKKAPLIASTFLRANSILIKSSALAHLFLWVAWQVKVIFHKVKAIYINSPTTFLNYFH